MMLTLPAMIAHSVPDAAPLRCADCPSLIARHHPAGMIGPHGTSARCVKAVGGTRLIGWEWKPQDVTPTWCPRRSAAA